MEKPRILLTTLLYCLLRLQGAAAQMVTLESSSPQPTCPNQVLVYNCQLEFPATFMQWEHPNFGNLGFAPSGSNVGDMKNSSDNRVVATLTRNDETSPGLGQFMMASTLTIYPPLNRVNGSNLNNTVLTCRGAGVGVSAEDSNGVADIMLAGEPSPPYNLRNATPDDMPSTTIEWDPPLDTGGSIQMYRIEIPERDYLEEENGTAQSHTIREGSNGIRFNTPYEVEVTAINTCDNESVAELITVNINASAPPEPTFLDATLMCNVGSRTAHLTWMHGTPSVSVYTPPTDAVTVEIDDSAGVSANECVNLSASNTTCSFTITEDGEYTVTLSTANEIGTTSNEMAFNFNPLLINASSLANTENPHILVSVNSLCQDDDYSITVSFGTRPEGTQMDCKLQLPNITRGENMSSSTFGEWDWLVYVPQNITLGAEDEYCFYVVLRGAQGVIDVQGDTDGEEVTTEPPSSTSSSLGLIVGIVCGVYGYYSGVMSSSTSNMYWLLPLVAGLSGSLTALIAVGMVTSIALFPIGIVLLIVTCCCCHGNDKSSKECYDGSYHNPTIATILLYIGVVTSIILFPLGIAALIVCCFNKERARCVVISFGIAGCVMVFPIGLVLLFVSYCCCPGSKSDDQSPMQFQDLSNCHKALVYIGGVASAIIFPVGLMILIYHLCCERQSREKDDQEMKNLRSGSSPDPESPPSKEPPPTGPMYQDPSTIEHVAHPETGETYAVVQQSGKKKKKGKKEEEPTGPMYQDPQTIEHQQAEGGQLYALPDSKKKKKKGKKGEEPKTEEELSQMYSMPDKSQKQKSEGLTYADIDLHASSKQPPAPKTSEYADIQHPQ